MNQAHSEKPGNDNHGKRMFTNKITSEEWNVLYANDEEVICVTCIHVLNVHQVQLMRKQLF